MKKILYAIVFTLMTLSGVAQKTKINKSKQVSFRVGADMAKKDNFTNYVNGTLKGFNIGGSYDKYWNWYGLGVDMDFMGNQKPVYNDAGLTNDIFVNSANTWIHGTHYTTSTKATSLTRVFGGIGPSFKAASKNNKFVAELNLRAGITYTNGSHLEYSTFVNPTMPGLGTFLTRSGSVNIAGSTNIQDYGTFFHEGYTNDLIGTGKAQVRFNYYIKPNLGINLGGYYMAYMGSEARYNYLDWAPAPATHNYWNNNVFGTTPGVINFGLSSLSSYGINVGVTYRKGDYTTSNNEKNNLTVVVKDELTGIPLSNVEVSIVGNKGKIYNGKTDATGMLVIKNIVGDSYKVNGLLNEISTNEQQVAVGGNTKNGSVTLLHNDPRFTVQGKAINITTNQPEGGVSVTLKNNNKGSVKMSSSQNGSGQFGFQLDANSDFELVGKKDSYLSNIEKISTKGLNRSQTLYVELELGVQEVKEGKTVLLKQIYYDFNKADIRRDASSDLEKLITFLQDNPTVKVEVASHTDSKGSDEYNLKLSQERAQAVVDYLSQKGITTSRMIAKGYGETMLINNCGNNVECSEEQHQLNRRTEFKIVK